jgi:hypothetical protein
MSLATPQPSATEPLLPLQDNMPIVVHPEDLPYQINPKHPGHVLRLFFFIEVIGNTIESIFLVALPRKALTLFLAEGTSISPSLITLMQFFGMLWVGITVITALGLPNTPTGIETRRSVYKMYAVLDLMAVISLHYLAAKGPEYSGFAPKPMLVLGNLLTGALVLRMGSLRYPASFGRYEYILDPSRR